MTGFPDDPRDTPPDHHGSDGSESSTGSSGATGPADRGSADPARPADPTAFTGPASPAGSTNSKDATGSSGATGPAAPAPDGSDGERSPARESGPGGGSGGTGHGPDSGGSFGTDLGGFRGGGFTNGGFTDDRFADLDGFDVDLPDPLGRLLRPPGEFLPPPAGAFERIRRRARRRRQVRAGAGGLVVAALITGSVYLAGALSPDTSRAVDDPPASSAQVTQAPAPSPTPRPTGTPPTPVPAPGRTSTSAGVVPTPVTSGPPTPSATVPGPGRTPTPTGTSTRQTPAGTPQCTADQLSAHLGGGDAGAGNLYRYLVITNTSRTACHVTGFPGLSMLDANGNRIGEPATRERLAYQPVPLDPGASASDTIHTVNQQGTCLPASTSLRMYPPGSHASLVVPGQITECDNVFVITPFTGGETGNPPN